MLCAVAFCARAYVKFKLSGTVANHELTRKIYKFIPTFGKLMALARYQTKSRDKLVNHFCQLMVS